MQRSVKLLVLVAFSLALLACNFGQTLTPTAAPAPVQPPVQPAQPTIQPPAKVEPSPTLTSAPPPTATLTATTGAPQPAVNLDPCTLMSAAEAEGFMAEPAAAPKAVNGACAYNNAKDSLYMISVAAAQEQQISGILQGQALLLGFAGGKLDEARMNKIKALSAAQDYKGFFGELVAGAEGAANLKARLIPDAGSDLVYWAWITVPPRRQGAYVAVRGQTAVNINLVVSETQTEEAMLAASAAQANKIFERLPAKFNLVINTPAQPQPTANTAEQPTPTLVPGTNPSGPSNPDDTPTAVPTSLPAPGLVAPADGAKFNIYPRVTNLEWSAVPGASKYVVEIQGCSKNWTNCFEHPLYEKTSRETTGTTYSFKFMGAQPGQWRVWALDSQGIPGAKSPWWKFSYTK